MSQSICRLLCPGDAAAVDLKVFTGSRMSNRSSKLRLDSDRPGIRLMNYKPAAELSRVAESYTSEQEQPEQSYGHASTFRSNSRMRSLDSLKPKAKPSVGLKIDSSPADTSAMTACRASPNCTKRRESSTDFIKIVDQKRGHSSRTSLVLVRNSVDEQRQKKDIKSLLKKQNRSREASYDKKQLRIQKEMLLKQQQRIRARLRTLNLLLLDRPSTHRGNQ